MGGEAFDIKFTGYSCRYFPNTTIYGKNKELMQNLTNSQKMWGALKSSIIIKKNTTYICQN